MIGPKKLSAIRQELENALAASGEDPLRWLEERIAAAKHAGAAPGGSIVLESLQRFLQGSSKTRRPKKRVGTK